MPRRVHILADPDKNESLRACAESLARNLGDAFDPASLITLTLTPTRLELRLPDSDFGPVFIDLNTIDAQTLAGGRTKQPLARAVGVGQQWAGGSRPRVLDASAGLLGDTLLLAAIGCDIVAVERHPALHAMQQDALERLRADTDPRKAALAERITLVRGEAREQFGAHGEEVIYFDPMHPPRRKSALVKKEMRILRELVGDDEDSADVLRAALRSGARRVVVKMPRHASALLPESDAKPAHVHEGRAVRYEVYSSASTGRAG